MDRYCELLKAALDHGEPLDASLAALRQQGASKIEAVKAVREVKSVSLSEAKRLVESALEGVEAGGPSGRAGKTPGTAPSMPTNCLRCGSDKIIPPVGISDQGQHSDGTLKTKAVGYTKPSAWVFKGAVKAKLYASICGECGHTEVTAENPAALYAAFLKSAGNSQK